MNVAPSTTTLRLGTRGSMLARTQSQIVADALEKRHRGLRVELIICKTTGDRIQDQPLHAAGGKGLFTKELEEALLAKTIDFAVHSFKDVPVTMPLVDQAGLVIAAVPEREDVRDVLVSQNAKTIADLPAGAKVGTGSLRRRCQLLALRSDLHVEMIRGNIDTRVRKLRDGQFDAVILAVAGMKRSGMFDSTQMFPIPLEQMLPAAAQGALAIQCRKEDEKTRDWLRVLNDPIAHACVSLERRVVQALNGDCHSPIAVLATMENKRVHLQAAVGARGGEPPVILADAAADFATPESAVQAVLASLDAQGAAQAAGGVTMSLDLDQVDRAILDLIQQQVPLERRPFASLAGRISLTEQEMLARINRLKARPDGVIRQISAIFDSRALGYTSCLVAAKVEEARIESAAAAISAHPGVSHNYRRDHAYNLWYTVAVPPQSLLGLQKTVDLLHGQSGASVTRLMPSLKLYKIGVKFNLGDGEAADRMDQPAFDSDRQNAGVAGFKVSAADKRMIRVLQQDLPIEPEPFARWAGEANVSVDELLATARRYESIGCMRRFSAVLRHRQAGFGANAMGAWIVPQDRQDEFGHIAAGFSAVSHCYLRPSYPDWPYSLFTMVHGQSRELCEQVLAEISRRTRIVNYAALYSTHEYKKVRVRYFTGDIEAWEDAALAASQKKE